MVTHPQIYNILDWKQEFINNDDLICLQMEINNLNS
jgi:hypothetical protein